MATRRHVTKAEVDAIEEYCAALMQMLRLPAWRVKVLADPCDDDSNAEINWPHPKLFAELGLHREWMKLDYDQRRETITHEVLHLMHARVSDAVHDDSEHLMHDHEHDDWWRRVQREFELMVDHLASLLSHTHRLEQAWDAAHGKT